MYVYTVGVINVVQIKYIIIHVTRLISMHQLACLCSFCSLQQIGLISTHTKM